MLALPRTGQPEYEAMIISYCFSGRCDRRRRLLNGLCSRRWSAFRRAQRTCAGPEQRFAPGISRCPGSTPSFALPARLLLAHARPSLSRDEEWEALLQSKGENAEAQMSKATSVVGMLGNGGGLRLLEQYERQCFVDRGVEKQSNLHGFRPRNPAQRSGEWKPRKKRLTRPLFIL